MKRLIALILALVLVVGLVACSGSKKTETAETTTAAAETTTAAAAETTTAAAAETTTAAAAAAAPADEAEAAKLRDAGTLTSDPKTGYEYVDSNKTWYYSNYPNYKDFKEDGSVKVAFVCKFSGAWFTPKQESLGKTVKDAGYEYQFIDANSDEQAWLDGIQNIINQDFDAVVMTPVNTALLPDAIASLQEAGLAYLTTDDPGADADGFYSPHYGLDDYYLHYELGKHVAEKMEERKFMDGVKDDYSNFLFVIEDSPSVEAIHKRNQAFYDAIMKAYPDIPEDRVIWLDCGGSLSDEIMEKFSSTLQANIGTVDKWVISSGGAAGVVPTVKLFEESKVDLKNTIIADCYSTADPMELMLNDSAAKDCCFGEALVSAPSGVGMGKLIIDLVENGTPIPAFTGYDLNLVDADNVEEFYNTNFKG